MKTQPPLVFFDFDGTLTTGDSLLPFLRHVAGTPRYCLQMARLSPVLAGYALGLVNNSRAKERVLQHCLGGLALSQLERQAEQFSLHILPGLLRHEGMERLRWHQQQGHRCVLVSASLELYLKPWAYQQGFVYCLASRLSSHKDTCTGSLLGANCYGDEKLDRIRATLPDFANHETFAYGDSAGDTAMLSACDHAFIWRRGRFHPFHH